MKKLIATLFSTITLTACFLNTSSVALNKGKDYKNFEEWCQEKSTLPEETQITIEILLKEAETQDCKKANQKLEKLTQLSFYLIRPDGTKIGDLKVLSSLTN
ncbi:MAG: hypothetical protein AAF063_37380, partial [Cyanobacteria bacterium J06643_5]